MVRISNRVNSVRKFDRALTQRSYGVYMQSVTRLYFLGFTLLENFNNLDEFVNLDKYSLRFLVPLKEKPCI